MVICARYGFECSTRGFLEFFRFMKGPNFMYSCSPIPSAVNFYESFASSHGLGDGCRPNFTLLVCEGNPDYDWGYPTAWRTVTFRKGYVKKFSFREGEERGIAELKEFNPENAISPYVVMLEPILWAAKISTVMRPWSIYFSHLGFYWLAVYLEFCLCTFFSFLGVLCGSIFFFFLVYFCGYLALRGLLVLLKASDQ